MRQTWRTRQAPAGRSGTKDPRGGHQQAAASWRDLGRDALGSGEPAEALWFLRHAVEIDSDDPLTWQLLGRCFELIGARDRARRCYQLAFRQGSATAPRREPRDS